MNSQSDPWWPGWLGAAVALTVAILGTLEGSLGTDIERPLLVSGAMVVVGIALFFRRVQPIATLVIAFAGLGVAASNTADGSAASILGAVAASVNVGYEMRWPRVLLGPVVIGAASVIAAFLPGDIPMAGIDIVAMSMVYGGSIAAGFAFRQRIDRVAELAARAARLEQEREIRTQEAVDAERARIARELHDIVSHSISVVVVQTQAVRRRLGPEQQKEVDDLRAIETVGRQAMAEMRRMLGVLRSQGGEMELEPQPGLGQLARLVEDTRKTGLPVSLTIEGDEVPLPPGVDLAAYRIVQEALTNVRKHAGDASATVFLRYGDHALDLEVSDNGTGSVAVENDGGHGLVGMKERVAVYGGTLEYGRQNGRGFLVKAHLPVREEALRD